MHIFRFEGMGQKGREREREIEREMEREGERERGRGRGREGGGGREREGGRKREIRIYSTSGALRCYLVITPQARCGAAPCTIPALRPHVTVEHAAARLRTPIYIHLSWLYIHLSWLV